MLMLEFSTRDARGERTYRDVIGAGLGQLDSCAPCPACGYRDPRRAAAAAVTTEPVVHLPERPGPEREARHRALQPTAARLAAVVRGALRDSLFAIWIAPLVLVDAKNDTLYLAAPQQTADWAAERYGPLLRDAASQLAGRSVLVEILAAPVPTGAVALGRLVDATAAVAA